MTDSLARRLATFLAQTTHDRIPGKAVEHGKLAIADTIGGALAGVGSPSVGIVRDMVLAAGGVPEATLWGIDAERVPVVGAARANAVLADGLAVDESHMATVAHVCGVTVPAAMAMGERLRATGPDVIAAVVLGYEAAGRIGKSIAPDYFYRRGFHNSVITIFGAAVAAAKLLALGPESMTHAIALAATSAGGLTGSRKSPAREYHGGNAAMLGVNAALAASAGYRAEETVLESPEGYCHAFGAGADPARMLDGLGESWEIVTEFAPKFMPGSHGVHTVVEATLAAIKESRVSPGQIARISVKGPAWKRAYAIYHPRELATASHSIPYLVAQAVLNGESAWADLTQERIEDPATRVVQDKVEIVEDPERDPYDYPGSATATIVTVDGRRFTHTVEHALGTPQRGFSWEDIEAKYRNLAPLGGLTPSQIDGGLTTLKQLEEIGDIRTLLPFLVV